MDIKPKKMDAIKKVTMHFLNNGIWKPTTTRIYNDTIQKATTPDDIILALALPYRLCAVNFFFFHIINLHRLSAAGRWRNTAEKETYR